MRESARARARPTDVEISTRKPVEGDEHHASETENISLSGGKNTCDSLRVHSNYFREFFSPLNAGEHTWSTRSRGDAQLTL